MRASALALLTFVSATFQSHVAASAVFSRRDFTALFKRQESGLCLSECATLNSAVDVCSGTKTACMCTEVVATGLNTCVNCLYQAAPTSEVLAPANKLINTYKNTCSAFPGLPVASVTGAPPSSTTGAVSGTGAVPTTQISPGTIPPPITVTQTIIRPSSTTAPASGTTAASLPGPNSSASSVYPGFYPAVFTALGSFAVLNVVRFAI